MAKKRKRKGPKKGTKTPKKVGKAKRKATKKARKKRDVATYPGLDKTLFSKIKQEYHDLDYLSQLSPKEKDWMSRFMEEYLGAKNEHEGKSVHKKLNTKKGRKKIFDPNNARNRDIYSSLRAQGRLMFDDPGQFIEALQQEHYDAQDIEDRLIDEIDKKKLSDDQ